MVLGSGVSHFLVGVLAAAFASNLCCAVAVQLTSRGPDGEEAEEFVRSVSRQHNYPLYLSELMVDFDLLGRKNLCAEELLQLKKGEWKWTTLSKSEGRCWVGWFGETLKAAPTGLGILVAFSFQIGSRIQVVFGHADSAKKSIEGVALRGEPGYYGYSGDVLTQGRYNFEGQEICSTATVKLNIVEHPGMECCMDCSPKPGFRSETLQPHESAPGQVFQVRQQFPGRLNPPVWGYDKNAFSFRLSRNNARITSRSIMSTCETVENVQGVLYKADYDMEFPQVSAALF